MKAMNMNPTIAVEYNKKAIAYKCKKAISKFIDTYLVFFQMPTGMVVNPEQQQQMWRKG